LPKPAFIRKLAGQAAPATAVKEQFNVFREQQQSHIATAAATAAAKEHHNICDEEDDPDYDFMQA